MKALILVADGFDDLELFCPWYRMQEDGIAVTLASPGGKFVVGQHGYRVATDMPIREVNPAEYDLLVIPDAPHSLTAHANSAVLLTRRQATLTGRRRAPHRRHRRPSGGVPPTGFEPVSPP